MMLSRLSRFFYSCNKISLNQYSFLNLQKCPSLYFQNSAKRCFCSQSSPGKRDNTGETDDSNLKSSMGDKFKVFKEEDSQEVFDVFEEKLRISLEELNLSMEEELDPYEGLDMIHGKNGVLELPVLLDLLQRESARNIFVAKVPKEYTYTDYIVVATCKNQRQMLAAATFVRKAYKLLRYDYEAVPKIEGKDSSDWMALDLGNIVLHLFSTTMREKYDLETLWSVGSEYDDITYFKEEVVDVFDKYKEFIRGLQPAE